MLSSPLPQFGDGQVFVLHHHQTVAAASGGWTRADRVDLSVIVHHRRRRKELRMMS